MRTLVIIPARLESTRLPGKMLARVGEDTLIAMTCRAARDTGLDVVVATDSDEIAREVRSVGTDVLMTGPARNGTERCALALEQLRDEPDLVLDWQGDSPLTPPRVAHELIRMFHVERYEVATPVRWASRPPGIGEVTVGFDEQTLDARHFHRVALPRRSTRHWVHLGLYAYTPRALRAYRAAEPGRLEQTHGLEQLRWFDLGIPIRCVPVAVGEVLEINTPRDLRTLRGDRA